MMPGFKPSEVRMWRAAFPLIDTFGRAEMEFAAALMVVACKSLGDTWQALTPPQVGIAMKAALEEGGEMHHLKESPILPRPDMHDLVKKGFATFASDDKGSPIQFTEKGFEMLRKTVAR